MRQMRNAMLMLAAALGISGCAGMMPDDDCTQLEHSLGYSGEDCGSNSTADLSSEYIGRYN
ncbi:hypothetical protein LX81_02606 [Palleronia aestuarii]|uniref:Lipoprotein n=1 Tax=Palleronia aestuarii TaxID=568105 RepID=A0A2W7N4N4_9RHOB|nr:hypothetical protein [Palleronia aestuarii]PZX15018.1 hypothetical protein LX81_02606 [Palleronia aestuarii]